MKGDGISSRPEKQKTDLEYRLAFKRIDAFVTVSKTLIQWAALVGCAFIIYKCVAVLAGKETLARLGVSILGNIKVSDGILAVLTGGSLAYGIGQRALRRRNIERLTPRSIELEKRLDSNRTSSSLTRKGTTRPEDKT
jgi:hypothetical protein